MNFQRAFHLPFDLVLLPTVLVPLHGSAQNAPSAPIRNIVLVHGAWADGSSWSKVVPLLEAKGFHVVCVQNPLTSFAEDVAATNRMIDAQDGPVLLVGHSYGGAVITEAGNNPKVAGLVYVAAFASDHGELSASMGEPYRPITGVGEPLADGLPVLSGKGVLDDFAQDHTSKERMTLLATQRPTKWAALASAISAASWNNKPTWFVIASNDRTIAPQQEQDSARKMNAKTLTLQTSHVPMLSRPREVADFISEAANGKSDPGVQGN